jgi:predicted MFS family arabinose efflux permease
MTLGDASPNPVATDQAPPPAPNPPPVKTGVLSPFRGRNFPLLFSGQFISVIGDQVYSIALPWTVLAVTGDPRQMSIVLAAEAIPRALLLLIGGALADRLTPRIVMLAADLGRMVVVAALGVILFFGLPPLWIVASLAALQGVGSGLFGPGVQALLPRILPEEQLPAGNGLMQIVQFATLAFGPLLGGVATAAQATIAFLADAASFGVSALTLAGVRLPARPAPATAADGMPAPRRGLMGEIGEGIRYTFRQPLIRSTMTVTVFGNLGFTAALNVGLIVLSRNLSQSPVTLGELLSAAGVGGIIGGLFSSLFGRVPRRGVLGLVLFGISALVMVAVAVISGPAAQLPFAASVTLASDLRIPAVAVALGVIGFILGLADTMFLTVMQQRIAPEYLARVFSLQFLAGGIIIPVSLLAGGYLTAAFGPGITFIAGGAATMVGVIIGLSSRELRRI